MTGGASCSPPLEIQPTMHSRIAKLEGLRILSLDGGDARCMSELHLLNEFMHRLEDTTGKKLRPCDYFHLIVGSGAAGFIAVLLGLFGMTIEEAMQEFYSVYDSVFDVASQSPQQRAGILQDKIKSLMARDNLNIPESAKLEGIRFGGDCKVAICYSSAAHMDRCRVFCNFGIQHNYQPTVIETICASWAVPELVSPAVVGPLGREENLVSALGFTNPTQEAINAAYIAFGAEARVSCLISLGSGKRGVLSIHADQPDSVNSIGLKIAADTERIAEEVERRIGQLKVYHRFSVDNGLQEPAVFCADFGIIKSHSQAYLSQQATSEHLERCIRLSETPGTVSMERIYRSRANTYASHGLPPLSAFFVMRKKPMEAMERGLLEDEGSTQRIMLLSGLGGSGKTQLALKFARDHEARFQHILFIDASSVESIESGLISRVRSIDPDCDATTVKEALEVLAYAIDPVTKDWLVVFDNADDPKVKLSMYIPICDHGAILITSQNALLDNLAPNSHYELEAMCPEEATEALLASIFPLKSSSSIDNAGRGEEIVKPTMRDRATIASIAERLGYLPIAVIQAGCYIRQQRCTFTDYIKRLDANRNLLARPTFVIRETLRYDHSVYAAFDCSLKALAPRALQLLGVLSFFHFANFPRPLFSIAAKSKFLYDPFDLLDRPPEFHQSAQFLMDILCPDDVWEEDQLDDLLQELQQYSLVTLVPTHAIVTLRFHPLVHRWARDRMTVKDQAIHRAAAVRLLTCGTSWDNDYIFEYLASHIGDLATEFNALHVNDRAAMSQVMRHEKKGETLLQTWKGIYKDVVARHGVKHVRTTHAALGLGDAYGENSNAEKMEELEREVVAVREELLGTDHEETLLARSNLARTLCNTKRYREAEEIQKAILRIRIRSLDKDTALSLEDLAATYHNQKRYSEEQALMMGAVDIRTVRAGRSHVGTIGSIEVLAECHQLQGHVQEAERLVMEAVALRQLVYGDQHLVTVGTMTWMARRFHEQERYEEAEELRREEVEIRMKVQGERHYATLHGMFWLGQACYGQNKFAEAADLWEKVLQGMKALFGNLDANTLSAMHWTAKAYYEQANYAKSAELWEENLKGRKEALGDRDTKTLDTAHCLAGAYAGLRLHEKAASLRKQVYEGRYSVLGEHTKSTADAIYWVGQSFFEEGKLDDAEKWTLRALGLMKEIQGPGDTDTLRTMNALSFIYMAQGRHNDAARLLEEELKIRQSEFGNDIATLYTIHLLAQVYHELGQDGAAVHEWRKILDRHKTSPAEHSSLILDVMDQLASTYESQELYGESIAVREEELEMREKLQGERDSETLAVMFALSRSCFEAQRYEEAEKWASKVIQLTRESLGERHASTLESIHWLGKIHYHRRQYIKAIQYWRQELEIRKIVSGVDDHTLSLMQWLAGALYEEKRFSEAEEILKEEARTRKQLNGPHDPLTLRAIHWSARCIFQQSRYREAELLWREELEARRSAQGESGDTLSIIHNIVRACLDDGRFEDARTMAKELDSQREMLEPDDPILSELAKLLQFLDDWATSVDTLDGPLFLADVEDGALDPIDEDAPTPIEPGPGDVHVPQAAQRSILTRNIRPVLSTRQVHSWSMLF